MTVKVNESVKLSSLPADTLVSYEDARYTLTAAELIEKVTEGEYGEWLTWYVATEKRWQPNAKYMLERYIENEYDELYEEWDEKAFDCLNQDHYDRIQAVLDEAFKGDSATVYWVLDGPVVEIDC